MESQMRESIIISILHSYSQSHQFANEFHKNINQYSVQLNTIVSKHIVRTQIQNA